MHRRPNANELVRLDTSWQGEWKCQESVRASADRQRAERRVHSGSRCNRPRAVRVSLHRARVAPARRRIDHMAARRRAWSRGSTSTFGTARRGSGYFVAYLEAGQQVACQRMSISLCRTTSHAGGCVQGDGTQLTSSIVGLDQPVSSSRRRTASAAVTASSRVSKPRPWQNSLS